jgi:hypothetical protein
LSVPALCSIRDEAILFYDGGRKVARPLMPAVSSGASPLMTPITLIDWLTGSTRPPSRVTLAG